MNDYPKIHESRNRPTRVRFSEEFVFIDLADSRVIGMPLYFFPWLRDASDDERNNCQLNPFSVYWPNIDEGIDIIAMVSGLYMKDLPQPETVIESANATPT